MNISNMTPWRLIVPQRKTYNLVAFNAGGYFSIASNGASIPTTVPHFAWRVDFALVGEVYFRQFALET
jgi:hypothetical protein